MKEFMTNWGSYNGHEGPWHPGTRPFVMPSNPSLDDQILATITATEGGSWNAVNMYDTCICTVGLIQWCEKSQFSVSDMIGDVLRAGGDLAPLRAAMDAGGLEFKENSAGRFRFFQGGKACLSAADQKRVFLLNSTGLKNSWDDLSRQYAKLWTSSLVSFFQTDLSVAAQRRFTTARLRNWFGIREGKTWIQAATINDSPGARAFLCGYLSFAANNPTWAALAMANALETIGDRAPFSADWLAHVFESLTWHPGVSIYPHRYDKIRPVLEKQFGVDLPDLASDLKMFRATSELLFSTNEIQMMLVKLGHELGSSGPLRNGVDGVWGSRTTAAFKAFEASRGLPADGRPDPKANAALLSAVEALG